MEIKDLTPGFRIYEATKIDFIWYDYLCPMPVKNQANEGNYFILIDKRNERPVRMYKKDLEDLLNEGLFTLEAALDKQIELAEDWVKFLKNKRKEKQ